MNPFARVAVGGVAVVAMLLGALYLLSPVGGGIGSGPPAATPSPTPSPSPIPLGMSDLLLEPGTYVTADPFPVQITMTVPDGWIGNIGGPYLAILEQASGTGSIAFSRPDKVFADPCHSTSGLLDPPPGPTVDDLASALAGLPSLDVTTPVDAEFDGFIGKGLTITAPADTLGCDQDRLPDAEFSVWELPLGAINSLRPGQVDRVWIVDVAGTRLVIDATHFAGEDAALDAEIQAILDSVQIDASRN
jgi:hypothetical protein